MPDPLQSLKDLDPGEHVKPLPAAEVRRRGDAMRRRRVATIAVGASLAAALVAVPIALLSTDRGAPIDPATSDTVSQTPTGESSGPVTTEIPDDFPIETGLSTRDMIEEFGPAERGETGADVEPVEPCGEQIWPAGGVDTLEVYASGPEWWESRQLATYASPDEAVAVLEAARTALEGCTSYPGADAQQLQLQLLEGDTGYDDVTFGYSEASGSPGGTVVQMMRVGSAVVLVSSSGEFTADSLQLGADDLTYTNQELATHMCMFTEAGC